MLQQRDKLPRPIGKGIGSLPESENRLKTVDKLRDCVYNKLRNPDRVTERTHFHDTIDAEEPHDQRGSK